MDEEHPSKYWVGPVNGRARPQLQILGAPRHDRRLCRSALLNLRSVKRSTVGIAVLSQLLAQRPGTLCQKM